MTLERLIHRYYEAPSHSAVLAALRDLTTGDQVLAHPSPQRAAGFFIRLGQLEPTIVVGYREEEGKAQGAGQQFIQFVLHQLDSLPASGPLSRPLQRPEDLDDHWLEFFLTGTEAPVLRLIEVLEWPDLVRARLDAWLQKPSLFDFSRGSRAERLEHTAGIYCDLKTRTVVTEGDLDCYCLRNGPPSVREVLAVLPFQLTPEELLRMAMKGSALWSLGSNAQQHLKVLEICTREAGRRTGTVRQTLQQMIAAGSAGTGES